VGRKEKKRSQGKFMVSSFRRFVNDVIAVLSCCAALMAIRY